MNKKLSPPATQEVASPWDDSAPTQQEIIDVAEQVAGIAPKSVSTADFDIDGLMTDFPTAKDLERFVFDETGIVLNLKGRANKLKYQVAMDVLNGLEVDPKFVGGDNPYIDKTELVPVEDLKPVPARDNHLPEPTQLQNIFVSNVIPHTDFEARMQDKKISVYFRKYKTGEISYEIVGPIEQRPHGVKLDKFGRERPEIIKWVDPRSGEQTIVRNDGTLTPQGRKLRGLMQSFKVNTSNQWDTWIDREFISLGGGGVTDVWDLSK
jgi:hypothetical protein